MKMVYVTLLYLAVHVAEGYVITPIAQRHAVRLPPALTLVAQLFMWTVAGILGLLIATPLAAVGLVIVQKLYLERAARLKALDRVALRVQLQLDTMSDAGYSNVFSDSCGASSLTAQN